MKRTNHFRIATLSDQQGLGDLVTILASLSTVIGSIFPGMFRDRLTMTHLNQLFPGNGSWTVKYKQFILSHVAFVEGLQDELVLKTNAFTWEKMRKTLCKNVPVGCWQPYGDTFECGECLSILNDVMAAEASGIGQTPGGYYPGIPGTAQLMQYLPYIAGGVVLIMLFQEVNGVILLKILKN